MVDADRRRWLYAPAVTVSQGVLSPTGLHQYHLEFTRRPGTRPADLPGRLAGVWSPQVTGRMNAGEGPGVEPAGGLTGVVVGFSPALWDALAPGQAPAGLRPAYDIPAADGRGVVATQRDLWVWLNGSHYGTVLSAALRVVDLLADVADLAAEQACFLHQDSRTWEGFIDGTENPGVFQAPLAVFVPNGQPGAGGSTAIVQRWVNDRTAEFEALQTAQQELVFGRTKRDSVELDPLPATSHVARTTLEVDGVELAIFRRNIPFGTVTERGYIFVGFAADQTRVTRMLERMFGADTPAGHGAVIDVLTAYTRPLSSSSYFVPSLDALASIGAAPSD
jgi:porphyrinogen peroxidase